MANFNSIKHEIDQNVNTNGQQAITGAILNETLKDMLDAVDTQKQDTLVAGQNITISGNVISATGGGGIVYNAGEGIQIVGTTISTKIGNGLDHNGNGEMVVDPSEFAGNGLQADGNGNLEIDPNVVATQTDLSGLQPALTAGSNIQISAQNVISATDTTYSAGDGLEIDANNEISVKAGTGLGFDANGYLINTGGGGGGTTYTAGDGIEIDQNDAINAKLGSGLQLDQNNNIEVDTTIVATQTDLVGKQDTLSAGDAISSTDLANGTISVDYDDGLALNAGKLVVWVDEGLTYNSNGALKADLGNGLQFDQNSAIEVDPSDIAGNGLEDGGNGALQIKLGSGLAFDANGAIETTGGGGTSYTAGSGIDIDANNEISVEDRLTLNHLDVQDEFPNVNSSIIVLSPDGFKDVEIGASNTGASINIQSGSSVSSSPGDSYLTTVTGNGKVHVSYLDSLGQDSTAIINIPQKSGTFALTSDIAGKQDTLTASSGISIDASNNISVKAGTGLAFDSNGNLYATGGGGGSYSAGTGISIANNTISVNTYALSGNGIDDTNDEFNVKTGAGLGIDNNGAVASTTFINDSSYASIKAVNATSAGTEGLAAGHQSEAGNYSVALGWIADASGDYSAAIGCSNTAFGDRSTALGSYSDANGLDSITLGYNTVSNGDRETSLGIFNKSYSGNNDTSIDTVFEIGNGTNSTTDRKNVLEIKKNNDTYLYGVGGFDGTNSAAAQTLQDVINNGGGGGTTYGAGSGIDIDANDDINVKVESGGALDFNASDELVVDYATLAGTLAGSGLQVDSNTGETLEVDYSQIPGNIVGVGLLDNGYGQLEVDEATLAADLANNFLPLTGGILQEDPNNNAQTNIDVLSPDGNAWGYIYSYSADTSDPNNPVPSSTKAGIVGEMPLAADQTYSTYLRSNGTVLIDYTTDNQGSTDSAEFAFPQKPSGQTYTLATLDDISGGGSYVAGNGIDITSGTISVDETYLDSVYLPIIGGSLENTSNHTDLRVDAPNAESDNFVDILSPGTGVPSVELGTDTNTQGAVESLKFKGDADIDIKYVGDNTTYTLSFPTLTQNDTIATLSDISGGGSYLPLSGGQLQDTAVGATETLLDVAAPDSTSAISMSADTLSAMIQMSADRDDANVADGTTYGVNFDNSGDVDVLVKTVNPLDPTDISTTTYTQTFQQKSGTIALLSDISGGSSYTAGTGISISAQNVISNSAPGLWVAGTGSNAVAAPGLNSSRASGTSSVAMCDGNASGNYSLAVCGVAHSPYSTALGYNSEAGYNAITGQKSIALGEGTLAYKDSEIGTGYYNRSYNNANASVANNFSIGSSNSSSISRYNVLEVKQDDRVLLYGVGNFVGNNPSTSTSLQDVINGKQDTLTAGSGISISGNVISATGGGGSGLWVSGTGTDSVVAPGTVSAGLTGDAAGTGAVSCGYDSNANGNYSFASGGASTADGDYSFVANNGVAAGDYAAAFNTSGANGDYSFAAGYGSTADAIYSIALGGGNVIYDDTDPNNIIDAQYGVAIGEGAIVQGQYAAAFGPAAMATGASSVGLGSNSNAEGAESLALPYAGSTGDYSLAGGFGSWAAAFGSIAIGHGTMTYDGYGDPTDSSDPNAYETALGKYNYTESGIAFSIGCGYEDNTDPYMPVEVRQNAVAIDNTGKIYLKGLGGYTGTSISGCTDLVTFLNSL